MLSFGERISADSGVYFEPERTSIKRKPLRQVSRTLPTASFAPPSRKEHSVYRKYNFTRAKESDCENNEKNKQFSSSSAWDEGETPNVQGSVEQVTKEITHAMGEDKRERGERNFHAKYKLHKTKETHKISIYQLIFILFSLFIYRC